MTTYTVTAERGRDPRMWVFQCAEFPGAISQSRRLADARVLIREVISFVPGNVCPPPDRPGQRRVQPVVLPGRPHP